MRFRFFLCLTALMATVLAGCSGTSFLRADDEDKASRPLKVAATIFPYYDFARQIAGDKIDLSLIIPAGMDSHSFEPTPAQMLAIGEADLVICNGGTMELWLEDVLDAADAPDQIVLTMMDYVGILEEQVVEGMEVEKDYVDHDGEEVLIEYDEHIWTSPVNAMTIVNVIAGTLAACDEENAPAYRDSAGRYCEELKEIDEEFRKVSRDRVRSLIVVAGKFPFRYLADEYRLDYRAAFTGCSTDTEPSVHTIAYLIDKIKEENIPVVYYPELSSTRVAEIIGEETGALPLLLHSCHNVTRQEFDSGVTYADLQRANAANLRKGIAQ